MPAVFPHEQPKFSILPKNFFSRKKRTSVFQDLLFDWQKAQTLKQKKCKNNVAKSRCNNNRVKIRGWKFLQRLHFTKMMKHKKVCHMCAIVPKFQENVFSVLEKCFITIYVVLVTPENRYVIFKCATCKTRMFFSKKSFFSKLSK